MQKNVKSIGITEKQARLSRHLITDKLQISDKQTTFGEVLGISCTSVSHSETGAVKVNKRHEFAIRYLLAVLGIPEKKVFLSDIEIDQLQIDL